MKPVKPDGDSLAIDFDTRRVLIQVDDESKLLIFSITLLLEDGSPDDAIIWANELNRIQNIVQFYIAAGLEDKVYWGASCSMSYEMGIIPFQVVDMARQFDEIYSKGIMEFYKNQKN